MMPGSNYAVVTRPLNNLCMLVDKRTFYYLDWVLYPPKSIRSDDNAVFIRVFNATSWKTTHLDKQYMESMVPHKSRGMTRNDVQASTRPSFSYQWHSYWELDSRWIWQRTPGTCLIPQVAVGQGLWSTARNCFDTLWYSIISFKNVCHQN